MSIPLARQLLCSGLPDLLSYSIITGATNRPNILHISSNCYGSNGSTSQIQLHVGLHKAVYQRFIDVPVRNEYGANPIDRLSSNQGMAIGSGLPLIP